MADKKINGSQVELVTTSASGAMSAADKVLLDSRLPTADQKGALDAANAPTSGNKFLTQSDITGGLPTGEIPTNFTNYDSDISGIQTTTSGTFVDITGMDLTLTLNGTVPSFVTFNFTATRGAGGSSPTIGFRIQRVTGAGAPENSLGMQVSATTAGDMENGSVTYRTGALAAGTYTFRPQWRRVTGTADAQFIRGQFFAQAQQAPIGATGAGVATGGTTGQVLTKNSGVDFDTGWTTVGGSGTVTSVAASSSEGVTISGSPITTSGTINVGLGAITPTSVAASGAVTGSNLSGTNTGDQTITLTGDVTGSGTGSFASTLANTAVTPGSYTSTNLTVDSKGRITAAANGSSSGSPLTTKGDVFTFSTVDARLPVGTDGQVLTADSAEATGIKWAAGGGGGGGASFPIGAIVAGPTAPTGDGTWLRCDGSEVSKTTYAALFASIDHDFLTYRLDVANSLIGAGKNLNNTWKCVFDGTGWVSAAISTNGVGTSANGISWSSATNLPFTPSASGSITLWTNGAGRILVYSTAGSANLGVTTNQGTSWTLATLPAAGAWTLAGNGSTIVGVQTGVSNVIYSTNGGLNWTNAAAALGTAIVATNFAFWHDGTNWVILDRLSSGITRRFVTSVADGSSGWTSSVSSNFISANNGTVFTPGSTTCYGAPPSGTGIQVSTDSGVTYTIPVTTPPLASQFSGLNPWNGLHHFSLSSYASVKPFRAGYLSASVSANSLVGTSGGVTLKNGISSLAFFSSGITSNRFYPAQDMANKRMIVSWSQDDGAGTTAFFVGRIQPNIDTSINFNLPLEGNITTYGLMFNSRIWIKAL